jgi:hypothetical protein
MWQRAIAARDAVDPLATFGKGAIKTEPFARALAGDTSALVVDIHMVSAGYGLRFIHGGFTTADYRRAVLAGISALRSAVDVVGVPATTVQATIWLHWLASRPVETESFSFSTDSRLTSDKLALTL